MSGPALLLELGERAYAALQFEEIASRNDRGDGIGIVLRARIKAAEIRNLFYEPKGGGTNQ